MYGFFHTTITLDRFSFFQAAIDALVFAFGGLLIFSFTIQIPAVCIMYALDYVGQEKRPFLQAFKFVLFLTFLLIFIYSFFDAVLTGGSFLYFPLIHLIFYGTLEGTYWDCIDWVIEAEGSYCADDRFNN